MAKERIAAEWREIDPTSLSSDASSKYAEYKAIYKEMKEAKLAFETKIQELAGLPSTHKLVFSYNFGKLSVAVVADDKPKAKPATQSLADWLAGQASGGNRT